MIPLLLNIIYLTLGLPYLLIKIILNPHIRDGFARRFGSIPGLDPAVPRLWIHAASVGEATLIQPLIHRLRTQYSGRQLLITTNTSTGLDTARKLYPDIPATYMPFDLTPVLNKAIDHIHPIAIILVELELWPNLLYVARRRGIPVAVVNGRITARSHSRYKLFGPIARHTFNHITTWAVQTPEYADRLRNLGVPADRITIAGTMKYDAVETTIPSDTLARYRQLLHIQPDDIILLAGCTHPGEEQLFIDYIKTHPNPHLRLILAPRHTDRVPQIEKLITDAGYTPIRKTALDSDTAPPDFHARPHIIILNTTGELRTLYAIATITFIGGSLIRHGGQNVIEPAALGKPVIVGPHVWNFREPVQQLLAARAAIQIDGPEALPATLDALIDNPAQRDELGRRAQQLIQESKGAANRNLDAIRPLLENRT